MNVEALKNAGIDYDSGVKRFMGREHLYMKTLAKFPQNDTIDRVRTDYAEHNMDALLRDVHEFKGMCGNMSMTHLAHTADVIVSILRFGTVVPTELAAAMGELEKEYATAKDAILIAAEVSE